MQVLPLVRRSHLLPGESLPSFMIRLAALNHYSSSLTLQQMCSNYLLTNAGKRDSMDWPCLPETYTILATMTRCDPSILYKASSHCYASILTPPATVREIPVMRLPNGNKVLLLKKWVIRQHFRNARYAVYCPKCLRENLYHRSLWQVNAVSACTRHRCLLVDSCPGCNKFVSLRDVVE